MSMNADCTGAKSGAMTKFAVAAGAYARRHHTCQRPLARACSRSAQHGRRAGSKTVQRMGDGHGPRRWGGRAGLPDHGQAKRRTKSRKYLCLRRPESPGHMVLRRPHARSPGLTIRRHSRQVAPSCTPVLVQTLISTEGISTSRCGHVTG
jgi:hypothetical protein